jgi:hypothetical protein
MAAFASFKLQKVLTSTFAAQAMHVAVSALQQPASHFVMPTRKLVDVVQALHTSAPDVSWYLPLAHERQYISLGAPSYGPYLPATQSVHDALPATLPAVVLVP